MKSTAAKDTVSKDTPVKDNSKETPTTEDVVEEKVAVESTVEGKSSPSEEEKPKEEPSAEEKKSEGEIVEPAASDVKEVKPESAKQTLDVPSIDKNAPLKIDSMDEIAQEAPLEKSNKRLFLLGTVAFVATVVIVTAVGMFWISNGSGQQKKAVPVEEKVTATPTPAVLKREDWTLEVLNGSGVAGAAKKAADSLGTAGYKISKTGNAVDDNKSETQVFVSSGKSKEDRDLLIEDLKSKLNSASYAGELKDSEASVRIVLGAK